MNDLTMSRVDRHDAAIVRMRQCFDAEGDDAWLDSIGFFSAKLSEEERAGLAYAMLRSLPAETAYAFAQEALDRVSCYLPPLDPSSPKEALDAARMWAEGASQDELKAAAMVSVQRMPKPARDGFIGWLRKRGWL